jgi:hypothetical protein
MYDGTYKNVEDLYVGDELMSLNIPSVPDSEYPDYLETWSVGLLDDVEITKTYVTNTIHGQYSSYYKLNNSIEITFEHFVLSKSDDSPWSFKQVESLSVGDFILDESLNVIEIASKEKIEETINAVSIDTEIKDVYFVRGMLAHNNWLIK